MSFLALLADPRLDGVRTIEETRRAITGRIARRVADDTTVPDFIQHQIDEVVEQTSHIVMAEFPDDPEASAEEQEARRYERLHVYYAEFLKGIDRSLWPRATRQFDEYVSCLLRNAQEAQYQIWTDGVSVHVA